MKFEGPLRLKFIRLLYSVVDQKTHLTRKLENLKNLLILLRNQKPGFLNETPNSHEYKLVIKFESVDKTLIRSQLLRGLVKHAIT